MPKALVMTVLLAATVSTLSAQDTPAPAKLTLADLASRPELRPSVCRLKKTLSWSKATVTPDQDTPIIRITETSLSILLPNGSTGSCSAELTDVVERANAVYAKWSPEQRAVDQVLIERRLDLWPATVSLRAPLHFGDKKLNTGDAVKTLRFKGGKLVCSNPKLKTNLNVDLYDTDFYSKFRAKLDHAESEKRHWILAELQDKVVQLPTGRAKRVKKVKVNPNRPSEYTLIYMSADTCGYCHEFAPELIAFSKKHKRKIGKRLDIIWVSRDSSEADMLNQARSLELPWPAVAWDQLEKIPRTLALQTRGVPHLALLNEHGGVMAASWAGKYEHPRQVLAKLDTLLESKKNRKPKKRRK